MSEAFFAPAGAANRQTNTAVHELDDYRDKIVRGEDVSKRLA